MMQQCASDHNWTKFISMQNHYNLLYREEEREMNAFCNVTGVGLIPWAPLCRGILARPPSAERTARSTEDDSETGYTEVDRQIVKRVQETSEKKGWKMSHVAMAWINKRVSVAALLFLYNKRLMDDYRASPIIGFSSVERIDEALECRGKELTAEEEKYLEELYVARAVEGHS